MPKTSNAISLSPLKITLLYLVVAGLWIVLTDDLVDSLTTDAQLRSTLQTYKGWFYVVVTSLGLFYVLRKYKAQIRSKELKLENLISDLKSEKELKDVLFDRIPVLITIYDPDLHSFEVNDEFAKVTGWSNDEIEQEDVDLLKECYPDFDEREEIVEFMKNPGIGWKEFTMESKSGKQIPVSWTNVRLTDDTSVGIGIDMSDIKASQAKIRESRKLLKKIFESLKSSLIIVNPRSRTIVDCNPATKEIFGYSEEELIGSSTKMLHINEQMYNKFDEISAEPLEKNGSFQTEFQMQKKDGTAFYSDHTVTLVYDEEGEVDKVVSLIRDITDRKKNEQQLKKRQERLLRSQQIGKIGDWELNTNTNKISWSPMMYDIFDRDPELGTPSFEEIQTNYYGASSTKHNEAVRQAIENKEPYDIDLELKTEKGNDKYIRAIGLPKENDQGTVVKLLGIVQDITERKKSEKELEQRKEFIETTLGNLPIGVAVNRIDDGKVTLMNEQFANIYGWPKEILTDVDSFFEHVYPDEEFRQKIKNKVMQDMESGQPERMSWKAIPITTQDGEEKYVNNKAIPLPDQNLMISTVIDVTEQKRLEQRLRESETKYRHIFDNNPEPMWIYNPDSLEYVEVNQAAIDHYGYTEKEFLNMTLADIRPTEDVEKLKNTIEKHRSEQTYVGEWRHLKKDGTLINVEVTAANIQYRDETYRLALMHDITEQKRMQEKIIQSVIEGEDRERKRIASELHDGLGQYLVAANMNFQSVKDELQNIPGKREKQFQTGLSHLKKALSETRNIAYNLMPKAIADYGLLTALENLVQDLRNSTDINVNFSCNRDNLELSHQAEINMYRILQEIISNAVQHSECSNISIILRKVEGNLKLMVEDDGKGTELKDEQKQLGFGLRSIKTRVNSLNGSIDIQSKPGEGMKISIDIPNITDAN